MTPSHAWFRGSAGCEKGANRGWGLVNILSDERISAVTGALTLPLPLRKCETSEDQHDRCERERYGFGSENGALHGTKVSSPLTMAHLQDTFGRVKRDLRISLTDRCNLRCSYCMPPEGLPWIPQPEILTDDEIVRVSKIAVAHGITKLRLTGGEPLLRPNLIDIVGRMSKLNPRPDIALTTNGIGLAHLAAPLAAAGLTRVNVSLDTLQPARFKALTHRDRFDDVIAGLHAAKETALAPIKVNSVLMRGVNDDEAPALLRWALDNDIRLRFIEQMPLDAQHGWQRETMLTADQIIESLAQDFVLTPLTKGERGSAPAEEFLVDGGPATVGIIGSVTRPFCADCDRIRLTADGQIRNCLFATEEDSVREILRSSGTDIDERVAAVLFGSVLKKKKGHGIGEPDFVQPIRPMSAIGG